MFNEVSNFHNGFRRLDLKSIFLTDEAQREKVTSKVTSLVIGTARTTTQFSILSIEASSHNNDFCGLCRGERPGPNVRWIHCAQ